MSYHDLQPLGVEKLQSSKLVVKVDAVSESGSRRTVFDVEVSKQG